MTPAIFQPDNPAPKLTALAVILTRINSGDPLPALTVDEIDELVVEFQSAQRLYQAAKEVLDDHKDGLIALIKAHGSVPPHAEQSKRLLGRRNVATITIGTTTTVHEDAIEDLGIYCDSQGLGSIFEELFATETKHKLIDGARNVLSTVQLPKRTHEKVLSLFGRCFDIKPKSPVLKVDVIEAVKPARKPRADQAAV